MTLIEQALDEGAGAEATVFGQAVDLFPAPKKCTHRSFGVDSLGAIVNDERGELARREVRIRVRCMECGVPCAVSLDVRRPKDGEEHGIVLVVTPMSEEG